MLMDNKFLILVIFSSLGLSCGNTDKKEINSIHSYNSNPKTSNTKETDFDLFLKLFNSDSAFQKSHIEFPIRVQEINRESNFELTARIIDESNYKILVLSEPDSADNYLREVKTYNNKATVRFSGIETGIMIQFFFEKINGKWMLTTWIDKST